MLIYKICLEGELFFRLIPVTLLALIFYIFKIQIKPYEIQIDPVSFAARFYK